MAGKFWEEVNVGDKFQSAGRTLTDGALDMFIGLGGVSEPLFTDIEFAKKTLFGGRVAPGPVTLLFMIGLWQQVGVFADTAMGLLGFDKVRFSAPFRPGDTIKVELELLDKREMAKPDRGMVHWSWVGRNQRGEVVAEMESRNLVRRRSG